MKKLHKFVLTTAILVFCLGNIYQAQAKNSGGLPSSLSTATSGGIVDAVYTGNRNEIVISDQSFQISPTLKVRSIGGQILGGVNLLSPGKKVAYKLSTKNIKGQSNQYLVEAWLLPANFRLPEDWM